MGWTRLGQPLCQGIATVLIGDGYKPLLAAVLMIVVSALTMAALEASPRNGQDVAAIFPPWIDSGQAIERIAQAGGAVVRLGATDTILVVHSDSTDFPEKLRAQGAWLVVDPVAFGGCLLHES
jgi:hypothetical protein